MSSTFIYTYEELFIQFLNLINEFLTTNFCDFDEFCQRFKFQTH